MSARRCSSACYRRRRAVERRAEEPEAAGVRVDDRDADRRARGAARARARRLRREPADALAHRPHARADAREALVGELAEADRAEVARRPSRLPLRGPRYVHLQTVVQSERTSAPGRAVDEEIGQIEETRRARATRRAGAPSATASFGVCISGEITPPT